MTDYPTMIAQVNRMEPVPRRIRAMLGGRVVLDTIRAMYLWESPKYPQYYIPLDDIDATAVIDESHVQRLSRGTARRIGLRAGDVDRAGAGRVYTEDSLPGLAGLARLNWDSLDAWFEEDEQVFVHPRNPYTRVDALRSTRHVRIGLDGVLLAETSSAVLVFETGLPTRYYVNRTEVDFTALRPSPTVTECPYKGRTTEYWSAQIGDAVHEDLAWSYAFPSAALLPMAGLVSFYNEAVDIHVDGVLRERPVTHLRKVP
uniref:DUF427 domain-containing protein n=1 Tax=Paractinoplanes polyasparticus TaxID=2856853 RepID=UPI001C841DC6|nr:DUF427 domain-containing protein [Actinoplanes polyasparticus]